MARQGQLEPGWVEVDQQCPANVVLTKAGTAVSMPSGTPKAAVRSMLPTS